MPEFSISETRNSDLVPSQLLRNRLPAIRLQFDPAWPTGFKMTWNDTFLELFDRCVAAYRGGNRNFETYYTPKDLECLAEIGYKTREFFDFVEDFCEEGEPSISTALLVAAVRRDYFLAVQNHASASGRLLTRNDIPTFGEELAGMPYLPRILAKARAKLRGELDPDLMFGCGGDRNFLKKHGDIHPADFLRRVWAAGEDDLKLAEWVAKQRI
jgi:hypothetical protein